MFEEIFTNPGFHHITENILINLDVKTLWGCRLVCKALHQFIQKLEGSREMKRNDFKIIRRICWKKFTVEPPWIAVFNSMCQEDNFYRRQCLIYLLDNQDKTLQFAGPIRDSYLNTSKL